MSQQISGTFNTTKHAADYCAGTMKMDLDEPFDPLGRNVGSLYVTYTGSYRPPFFVPNPLPGVRICFKQDPQTSEWNIRPESESFLDVVTQFMKQIGLSVSLQQLPQGGHPALGRYNVEGFGGLFGVGQIPADSGNFEADFV